MKMHISVSLALVFTTILPGASKASYVENLSLIGRGCKRMATHTPMLWVPTRAYGTIKDGQLTVAQALRDRETELGISKLDGKAYDDRFNELIKQGVIKTRYEPLANDASLEECIAWFNNYQNVSQALDSLSDKLTSKSLVCPSPHCPFLYSLEERSQLLKQATEVSVPFLKPSCLGDAATSAVGHSQWIHGLAQTGRQAVVEQINKPYYGNKLNDIYKITSHWVGSKKQLRMDAIELSQQDSIEKVQKLIDEALLLAEEFLTTPHAKKD